MIADQAIAFPQFEPFRATVVAHSGERVPIAVGLHPFGASNLAGSVEPIQSVSRQARNPPVQAE